MPKLLLQFGGAVIKMIANRPEGYFLVSVKEGYPRLNGRTLRQKALLRDGDVIELGGTTLQFEETA